MQLVKNEEKYWNFILELRNNRDIKQGFISQHHIAQEEHTNFMQEHTEEYYICLVENTPAGFAGVINKDIRVATHPNFQKKGVGKFMIEKLMILYPDSFAKVNIDNEASLRLFESCGFKKKYYILEKEDVT